MFSMVTEVLLESAVWRKGGFLKPQVWLLLFWGVSGLCTGAETSRHEYAEESAIPPVAPELMREVSLGRVQTRTHGARKDWSLNGFWDFSLSEEWVDQPAAGAEWLKVRVPSFWCGGPVSSFPRTAEGRAVVRWRGKAFSGYKQGWYRRRFETPQAPAGTRFRLRFDALQSRVLLKINGRAVELPWSGPSFAYREFPCVEVEITSFLRPACETNEILVATAPVEVKEGPEWTRAGLPDDVWLKLRPPLNLGSVKVVPRLKDKLLVIDIRDAESTSEQGLILRGRLCESPSEKETLVFTRPFARHLEIPYDEVKLWHVDAPNLYFLDLELVRQETVLDAERVRFGFRELSTADGRLTLNGEPLQLNTESSWQNMWQRLPLTGPEYSRAAIRFMKSMNINSVYSHRVLSEVFYDIADEEGFICIERLDLNFANSLGCQTRRQSRSKSG